jgi:hypothetical protein
VLLGATATTRLPISKIVIQVRKTVLRGKYLYAFPQNAWKAARHMKKADPYQPT